ncbi:MAG: hypothetical protein GY822_18030 [Deltaproteobacteria bacterium]|nr:hypothetical protein [Deltaproteobacteria bacterium]
MPLSPTFVVASPSPIQAKPKEARNDIYCTYRPKIHITRPPADEVQKPDRPISQDSTQNENLWTYLNTSPAKTEKLDEVGFKKENLAPWKTAIDALGEAEGLWNAHRQRKNLAFRAQAEKDASELRSDLILALRWNLRDDVNAQASLTAINEGTGASDLVQDLKDLAALIEKHASSFENDRTFDPAEKKSAALESANLLAGALSTMFDDDDERAALDLRNRAFTLVDIYWDDARRAGRYAFAKDDDVLSHFRDMYFIRKECLLGRTLYLFLHQTNKLSILTGRDAISAHQKTIWTGWTAIWTGWTAIWTG